jgi:hypothetical protein
MPSSLSAARAGLAEFRSALESPSPEEIERLLPRLAEAAASVAAAEPRAQLLQEIEALQHEIRVVRRMLEHGAAFYQGLARLLGAATAGYTPAGESAPLTAAPTISTQG